jgi:RHS repeat-associated protein
MIVTPSDATVLPTTHDFEQFTDAEGYYGLKYTRTENGVSETTSYLQWGGATIINNVLSGDFKYVAPDGDITLWKPMSAVVSQVSETLVTRPAAAGGIETTVETLSKLIGLDGPSTPTNDMRKRVMVKEVTTKRRNGSVLDVETIDRAYHESYYVWLNNTNTQDRRYGREKWSRSSKGAWVMRSYQMASASSGSPLFDSIHEYSAWKDGAGLPANLRIPSDFFSNSTSAANFFALLESHAQTSNYVVPGLTRRSLRLNQSSGEYVYSSGFAWHERSLHFIGPVSTGEEYSFYSKDSPKFVLVSGSNPIEIPHKTRTERVDRLGRMTWSADFGSENTTGSLVRTVQLDQLGIASISTRLRNANGEDTVDHWRTLVTSTANASKAVRALRTYAASTRHPLWSQSTENATGQTIQENSYHGLTGTAADTLYQTIDTSRTGDTAYTRSAGTQILESQLEDTIDTESNVLVRTSTRTDAQGLTTVTKTNEDTGEMISETKKGVDATAEFPAQPDVTTSYAKNTNATTGEVSQTVTQAAGGSATRTLSITVTDALGRTKRVTDEIGRVTDYDYSADGRTTTETLPSGLTRISTTYLDEQLKSITGTAAPPEFHDYTVNDGTNIDYEAGSITETTWTGWDGTGTAPADVIWRKTTTNYLGWVLREEQPTPAETGGIIATVHHYNAKGQRVKSQTTGQAAMLFFYDDWGNPTHQGLDINEDGVLTQNSLDMVSSQTLAYEVNNQTLTNVPTGSIYEVTTQGVWGRAGSTTTTRRDLRDAAGTYQEVTTGNGRITRSLTQMDYEAHLRWEWSGTETEFWMNDARVFYNGLLMSENRPGGKHTYQYDGFGRVTHVVVTSLSPVTNTDPQQTTTLMRLYTGSFLMSEQSSGTGTSTYSRDARTYTYYPLGHVNAGQLKTITEGGHVIRYGYDAAGRQTHQWGDAVTPIRYEYDTLGRLWKLHTYQGGTGWNSETLPESFTSPTATTTWTYRPGTNALWKKTDTLNRSVTYTYAPDGFLWKKENARGTTAAYSYAQTSGGKKIPDRVSGISYDDGVTPAVAFTYHPDGSLKTVTDAAGTQGINLSGSSTLVRNSVYYGNGLLNGVVFNRTQIDEDHPLTLQLNVAGEPVLPDANGSLSYNNPVPVFSQSYDWWLGKKLVLMNTGGLSYSYHNGLVRRRTVLGLGNQTNFRYMPDGAIKSIATETRRYSYRGRMMGIHGGSDSWDYTFDSRGRRETQTWGDWTPYSPDYINQYPRRWRYQYNERGEVETADREGLLQDEGTLIEPLSHQRRKYEYDLMGNRQTATQGTTLTEQADFTQVYSPQALQQYSGIIRGRTAEITGAAPEDAIVSLRIDDGVPFTVDRTQRPSQTVEHNSFRHLHTVTGPNADEARWAKMEFTATQGAASTQRRGFVYVPPANEVPQYDLDGNLIQDGQWVYTWDAENRLASATQKVINRAPGVEGPKRQRLEFAYDYMNRRIAKKVFQLETSNLEPATWHLVKDLRFVYNGIHMIAELDATFATGTGVAGITPTRGVVRTYRWGLDVSGTLTGAGGVGGLISFTFQGVSYFPISDANGNICAIHAYGTDQVIRFDYDPFGNRLTNTGPDVEICPMGFSSQYTDSETGLVSYLYRYYSPQLGRFLSSDPIEEQGGINLYGFVGNDPVNRFDVLGLRDFVDFAKDYKSVADKAITNWGTRYFEGQVSQQSIKGLPASPLMLMFYFRRNWVSAATGSSYSSNDVFDLTGSGSLKNLADDADKKVLKEDIERLVKEYTSKVQSGQSGHVGFHFSNEYMGLVSNWAMRLGIQHYQLSFEMSCDVPCVNAPLKRKAKCNGNFVLYDRYDFKPNTAFEYPLYFIMDFMGENKFGMGLPFHTFGKWQKKYDVDISP